MKKTFKLQFPLSRISSLSDEYVYANPEQDEHLLKVVGPHARKRGELTKNEFLMFCRWKSPRIVHHCQKNSEAFVREATRLSFLAKSEELRIGILTTLCGVNWPVASVLLHFCHRRKYPIMDFRALWSLGIEKPPAYDFSFWWAYVECCQGLAEKAGVSMRVLDRALWQHSKANQGK